MSPPQEKKELILGYSLWCLGVVGICGVQRLYLGQVPYGLALLFTFGFCGAGQLLDLLLLPEAVKEANKGVSVTSESPTMMPLTQSKRTSTKGWDPELEQLLRDTEKSVNHAVKRQEPK